MVDIDAQVRHWEESSREDWLVASDLIKRGRLRHGLFFAHLAIEKMLKARVCQHSGDIAPKIHNLVRLAEAAGLSLSPTELDLLADMNRYNLEGRYCDPAAVPPTTRGKRPYGACGEDDGMVGQQVVESIQRYLQNLENQGVRVSFAIVFGSQTRGGSNEWSDIDLIVVSPQFDDKVRHEDVNLLWRVAARTDSRIEPIPCGERQWLEDTASALIEIARREGERILPAA